MRDTLTICSDILKVNKVKDHRVRQESIMRLLGEIMVNETHEESVETPVYNAGVDAVEVKFLLKVKDELSSDPTKEWCIKAIDQSINTIKHQSEVINNISNHANRINGLCSELSELCTQ